MTLGPLPTARGTVTVVSAGTSDAPVAAEAALTARVYGAGVSVVNDVGVAGLHRVLAARDDLARADCLVVVAGMEGALPSVVGGLVGVPLVAVPTSVGYGASFGGLAALLAMLNSCAPGVTRGEHRQRVRRRRLRGPGGPQRRAPGRCPVIGWVDASSGASGDMLLGALVGAGVPVEVIAAAVDAVAPEHVALRAGDGLPARLRGHPAATSRSPTAAPTGPGATSRALLAGGACSPTPYAPGRTPPSSGSRSPRPRCTAPPPTDVHFHEVGALDAIADVVGVCAGLEHLGLDELVVSPVAVGSGRCTARTARCRSRRRRWPSCCAGSRPTPARAPASCAPRPGPRC